MFSLHVLSRDLTFPNPNPNPVTLMVLIFLSTLPMSSGISRFVEFELDITLPKVTCSRCVQMWSSDPTENNPLACSSQPQTCTGTACFMRQCKRCGLYQYISGCVRLTDWQIRDLQVSRQRAELTQTRAGAILLCEDNVNHTTCICNSRNRCNDIHYRIPHSTYSGNLFRGTVNIEAAIAEFDGVLPRPYMPRHIFSSSWYHRNSAPERNQKIIAKIILALFVFKFMIT